MAVRADYRKHGVAREMMLLLEERAAARGFAKVTLGAVQSAEGFYAKLGYTASLLIQSETHSIGDMLALNSNHDVLFTNVHDGIVNQICLAATEFDGISRLYKESLPDCHTQIMFTKSLVL